MDYDDYVFREAAENATASNLSDTSTGSLLEEVALTTFCVLSSIINILFIYIVCYFRKLHTSVNIYLVNWAIADTGFFIICIGSFRIISPVSELPPVLLCFYFSLECALIFTIMLIMLIIAVDWCLMSYFPRPLDKFRNLTKIFLAVIWLLTAVYSISSTALCSVAYYYLAFHYSLPILYLILLIFVLILHAVNFVQKIRKRQVYHSLTVLLIPTVFAACWFLSWLNILVPYLDDYLITDALLFLHPYFNFALLLILDKDFKLCCYQLVKRLKCNRSEPQIVTEDANSTSQPTAFVNRMSINM